MKLLEVNGMEQNGNVPIIEAKEICKSFSGVTVLNNVDFDLRKGEIHALIGENGAGKSTLSKIISGVIKKDAGVLLKSGLEINPQSTRDAMNLNIAIIHQEFNLIPVLSIAENIYLGREETQGIFIDEEESRKGSQRLLDLVDLKKSPKTLVKNLSVAEQQLVEIAKCLSYNSEVLIMDEPTAPLTKNETSRLFEIIRSLKEKGVSIIYVSHKLEEIFALSDRITVLRDGCKVGTYNTKDLNEKMLINLMVGRDLSNMYTHKSTITTDNEIVLKVEHLNSKPLLKDISFSLRRGEILGIAGLVGAGRTELVRAIFGADTFDSGTVEVFRKPIEKISMKAMIEAGIGFIPEDRKRDGIIRNLSVKDNVTLGILKKISKMCLIKNDSEKAVVRDIITKLNIKCHGLSHLVGNLSGGNQQKAILAKWLVSSIKIFILDEPTRGIDVGAKQEIYTLMSKLCEEGISIIMVSSELPEIIGMSDRVIIMSEGEITGEFTKEEITETRIMEAATIRA